MNNPLVSILIPCYNVEAYLPKCLDTVLGQTYANLQVVLIDDGSKDGTWSVMQEYAATDARIEIYHQENQGVAATRNHLLEKIKGDYVLFVDSDDWIELDMVEYMAGKALTIDCDVVTCSEVINNDQFVKKNPNEEIWEQTKVVREFLRHKIFNGSLWNKLIKTSLLHNIQFHCGISYGEDALFCWGILQRVNKVMVSDKILYHYRMNDESLSHQWWTPEKKGSSHIVWETIAQEVMIYWPQYADIARGNYAVADMWNIYYAAKSGYSYDENIHSYQQNIRKHFRLIIKEHLINKKKILFAFVSSRSYRASYILSKFI